MQETFMCYELLQVICMFFLLNILNILVDVNP